MWSAAWGVEMKGSRFWGYNPVCKVNLAILHGVVSPERFRPCMFGAATNTNPGRGCTGKR